MAVIPASEAAPGMVLAADVLDRRGRCLIPVGAELSERTVQALASWGIASIQIEGEELEIDEETLSAAREAIGWRFAQNDVAHPFIQALLNEAAKVHAQETAGSSDQEAAHVTHA